jgi:uncharacterized protein (TIGR03000 family)
MIGLLSGLALLLLAQSCQAQYAGWRGRFLRRPVFPPNRMPGWDAARIYPWSPYNYGRNPYNPIVYPYVDPYPVYVPYAQPYQVAYGATPSLPYQQPLYGASDSPQQVLVPDPTGVIKVPPPHGAVIRMYIPDEWGQVWFDGVPTESMGTTRYYVTPDLPGDKPLRYDVKATFKRGGQTVTEERQVLVRPGKTAVVDFTKAETPQTRHTAPGTALARLTEPEIGFSHR